MSQTLRWYLRGHGLEVQPVGQAEGRAHRAELHRRLRRVLANVPGRPMPHGKFAGHLWDLFPEPLRAPSLAAWADRVRSGGEWIAVPESPAEPTCLLQGGSVPETGLPRCDLYLLATDESGDVLAVDHEGEGPWWIGGDMPRIRPLPARGLSKSTPLELPEGARLSASEARAAKAALRKVLRRRIYLPDYPLATSGPAADHLWNYLPRQFDASLDPGSLARELVERAPAVMVWTDGPDSDAWRLPGSAIDWNTWPRTDTYVLEWPARRWLLAVPGEFLREGEESWVDPSLIHF